MSKKKCPRICDCSNFCKHTGKQLSSVQSAGGAFYSDGSPVEREVVQNWKRYPYGPYPGYAEEGGA